MRKKVSFFLLLVSLSYATSAVCLGCEDCLTKTAVDPFTTANVPCVFPFTYAGRTYTTCTTEGHLQQKSWCSTKVDAEGVHVEGEGHWGLCGKVCPQEVGCPVGWQRLASGCYRFEDSEDGIDMDGAQLILRKKVMTCRDSMKLLSKTDVCTKQMHFGLV